MPNCCRVWYQDTAGNSWAQVQDLSKLCCGSFLLVDFHWHLQSPVVWKSHLQGRALQQHLWLIYISFTIVQFVKLELPGNLGHTRWRSPATPSNNTLTVRLAMVSPIPCHLERNMANIRTRASRWITMLQVHISPRRIRQREQEIGSQVLAQQ